MAPTSAKSLMKDFRASFRRKKTDSASKIDKAKELEEEELSKLAELKESLGDNIPARYSDKDLLSFIRARSLNVNEAETLINLDINLRKFLDVDEFLKTYELSELNKEYSCSGLIGYDKEGCLVRVVNLGYSDIKGYMNSISTIDNFRLFIWYLEKDRQIQEAENKRTGRTNQQLVYILNLDQVSLSKISYKPAVDTAILSLKLLQDHYHDAPKHIFVINCPSFFSTAYKLFKPVIRDSLQKKIKIFDTDDWRDELLKYIDENTLPAYLGGKRVDSNGDEMCQEYIGFGGPVPKSYYCNEFLSKDDPDVIKACVPAGSSLNIRLPCPVPGSTIHWFIQAHENDIGIGLYMDLSDEESVDTKDKSKEDMSKYMQLTPVIRSQCHICPEIGDTTLWLSGTAIMHLDNTYSWMQSKEVFYKISVESPTVEEKKLPTKAAVKDIPRRKK